MECVSRNRDAGERDVYHERLTAARLATSLALRPIKGGDPAALFIPETNRTGDSMLRHARARRNGDTEYVSIMARVDLYIHLV